MAYYSWTLKQRSPLLEGLASDDADTWEYCSTYVDRYLKSSESTQAKEEPALRRYLISRKAHDAVRSMPEGFDFYTYDLSFWALLQSHLEWEETKFILEKLPEDYARTFITQYIPACPEVTHEELVKATRKAANWNMPVETICKLLSGDKI